MPMRDLLMVIDMQNDFVTEGGALYFESAQSVKSVVLEVVEAHMKKNTPVVFTQDWHEENDEEFKLFPSHCVKESWGASIFEELAKKIKGYPHAFFVKKRRFSAFYETDLDSKLKDLNPSNVEVCGVASNICVLFNVEELRNRGYNVIVYKDGTSSYDQQLNDFALREMKDVLGVTLKNWR